MPTLHPPASLVNPSPETETAFPPWAFRRDTLVNALGETEPGARAQLGALASRLPWATCAALLAATLEIEEAGGLWSVDTQARRTTGGVFFALLKRDDATRNKWWWIARGGPQRAAIARAQPPPPKPPPFDWNLREALVRALRAQEGTITVTPTTKLMGRPVGAQDCGDFAAMSLHFGGAPSLPKGLPQPPREALAVSYTVFVPAKAWKKVDAALKADPLDQMLVEGFAFYDDQTEGLMLLASQATTKETLRAKGAAKKAAPAGGAA